MEQIWNKHKTNTPLKRKVFVGLSGGVDSAVSAALLKKEGYEVTGVFIKAWTPPGYPCTWREDRRSAMRAAAILNIPFVTIDLEKEYKREVIDYTIHEYKKGNTPNPDVMCNKEIKFGAFFNWALEHGANFVATGHYAKSGLQGSGYKLKESKDKNKDQSYFLWTLTQKELSKTFFPVGNLMKKNVRKLAKKFGLPQAERKDSQGLCFLGQINMKEFLSINVDAKKGEVLDKKGNIVGCHDGAIFYTIGERHGFTMAAQSPKNKPFYVVGKNMDRNTITVAGKNEEVASQVRKSVPLEPSLELKNISWTVGKAPENKNLECRLRYRQNKIPCKIEIVGEKVKVFLKKNDYISPGQSLVFYERDICLGGGIIE